jgi:type IV pilus assembly protein PilW
MNARCMIHSKRLQRGMSLIELMVSVTISLVVMIALLQVMLASMRVDNSSSNVARMQESGRNALDLMGRVIRQAGARANVDVAFVGVTVNSVAGAPVYGVDNSSTPDTIRLQFEAQAGDLDCASNAAAAGAIMNFSFAVDTTVTPPTLTCTDTAGNSTVVANNIEDMQIIYGLDAARDGSIDLYKPNPTATEFRQAAAVRVFLVVRGPSVDGAANKTQTYTLNGTQVTKTDGFLRQVYSATFTVRNQAG